MYPTASSRCAEGAETPTFAVTSASGVYLVASGQMIEMPWQLYAALGVLVGGGANLMNFTPQSLCLPNWLRHRGLANSIAFSGVGVVAIVLLP
jgi:hypothetical protein